MDAASVTARLGLIPEPVSVLETEDGFILANGTKICGPVSALVGSIVADVTSGVNLESAESPDSDGCAVVFSLDAGFSLPSEVTSVLAQASQDWFTGEAYTLVIDADGVRATGTTERALFNAAQTLRQVIESVCEASPGEKDSVSLPGLVVHDGPRFRYRGVHLDVCRHFFPVAEVKKYIAVLARYKFNHFHWHLTEDQGWRVEIKAFPKLTEVGAWRDETVKSKWQEPYEGDGVPHGGFYTHDDIAEVVAFAGDLFITVVPEIEMPGHSTAAIAAYPELGCTDEEQSVSTKWGVHAMGVYTPTDVAFDFLKTVLREIAPLFPGPYIHIGGDEAPKDAWRDSDVAQAVIAEQGLADEDELQSWFISRMQTFVSNELGKSIIGWDEILEGGLPADAVVMSWRGMDGGVKAARAGSNVIMTPQAYCYLDHWQHPEDERESVPQALGGYSNLSKVHAFDPIPAVLREADDGSADRIIGIQANLWTEYIPTVEHLHFMLLPRVLAIADVAWAGPAGVPADGDFVDRVSRVHAPRLRADGYTVCGRDLVN